MPHGPCRQLWNHYRFECLCDKCASEKPPPAAAAWGEAPAATPAGDGVAQEEEAGEKEDANGVADDPMEDLEVD